MTQEIQTQQKQSAVLSLLENPPENFLTRLRTLLPRGSDRFVYTALMEVRNNPALARCNVMSFVNALMQVAQLRLELGRHRGFAYLIPFKDECTMILGYKGKIELANRCGVRIRARAVFDGDGFKVIQGTREDIIHEPQGETAAAKLTHAYAIATYITDKHQEHEVMTRQQIDAVKDRGRLNPVWNSDYVEMAKKTVINRLCKTLPLTQEVADAFALDAENEETFAIKASHNPRAVMSAQIAAADEGNAERRAAEARAESELDARELGMQ